MNCHNAHGSPNTNLLSVSEPALCLQCHAGHHNGAGLPLDDRCTNCHSSIHGTDVATPSGGSRFIDKGPLGVPSEPVQPASAASTGSFANPQMAIFAPALVSAASQGSASAMAAVGGMLAMLSSPLRHGMPGGNMLGGNGDASGSGAAAETEPGDASSAWAITPASYRLLDGSGFLGRAGEYDSLRQSAGANMTTAYVSPQNHLTLVSQSSVLSGNDYSIRSQLTVGNWLKSGLDLRSLVQQQDNYQFYAGLMSPDLLPITNLNSLRRHVWRDPQTGQRVRPGEGADSARPSVCEGRHAGQGGHHPDYLPG
jgi:predicted CXXCH cytochrome family protein